MLDRGSHVNCCGMMNLQNTEKEDSYRANETYSSEHIPHDCKKLLGILRN